MVSRDLAGEYPLERAAAHAAALFDALDPHANLDSTLRNLAPDLAGWTG